VTAAPQAETEVVTGTITGIIDKGAGKWQVSVQPDGSQYTKNLWTKDADLVSQLAQMVGQRTGFLCGASYWTNQQNQQVRSLWINGVGQGVSAPPQMPQPQMAQAPVAVQAQMPTVVQPQAQPMGVAMPQPQGIPPAAPVAHVQPPTEQSSRWLAEKAVERPYIHRQTATKVAAMLISHLPAEQRTLDNLLVLSERLVAYYEHGVSENATPQDIGGYPGNPADDDIPF
jgi:hypothetical protein